MGIEMAPVIETNILKAFPRGCMHSCDRLLLTLRKSDVISFIGTRQTLDVIKLDILRLASWYLMYYACDASVNLRSSV